jgi:DNA-binding CsgD family transcriptional regulator
LSFAGWFPPAYDSVEELITAGGSSSVDRGGVPPLGFPVYSEADVHINTQRGWEMLNAKFAGLLDAQNSDHLFAATLQFSQDLGFERFTAIAVLDQPGNDSTFHSIDNAPSAFSLVLGQHQRGESDPVMQHCKNSSLPLVWDRHTYVRAAAADRWEEQAPYGYQTGICVATHLPRGRHFCIGVDRCEALPSRLEEVTRIAAELQLFAAFMQDSALRILANSEQVKRPAFELSVRELECLRWTAEGKTAWEVGRILSICEQTAARHLSNAARKLGCVNKHQAVAVALRSGLIR